MPSTQGSDKLKSIFSSNLKNYMKKKDMNTADLARALSYSFTTVSDWVNGKKYPPPKCRGPPRHDTSQRKRKGESCDCTKNKARRTPGKHPQSGQKRPGAPAHSPVAERVPVSDHCHRAGGVGP